MPTDFDEWPDEPDEDDPEDRWLDPESDLVSVPAVDIPGETNGDDEDGESAAGVDVDAELAKFFWTTVVYANVALAGISLGVMLVAFRQQWGWGGGAIGVGVFALYRTYDLYRTYHDQIADDGERSDTDERTDRDGREGNGESRR